MSYWGDKQKIIGRKLMSVRLDDAKDYLTLTFEDGGTKRYCVTGDCCSQSWIEHLEMPDDVAGATLLDIDESDCVEVEHPDHECLKVYRTTFKTDKGEVVLEYRNSSNGYYGGSLEAVD